eukprot:1142080-Pelagomonas_calceolata.AAC.2
MVAYSISTPFPESLLGGTGEGATGRVSSTYKVFLFFLQSVPSTKRKEYEIREREKPARLALRALPRSIGEKEARWFKKPQSGEVGKVWVG